MMGVRRMGRLQRMENSQIDTLSAYFQWTGNKARIGCRALLEYVINHRGSAMARVLVEYMGTKSTNDA